MQNANQPTPDFRKMFQLAENYWEASHLLEKQARGEEWGASGPQLLVDSFAVELYLKCLYVADKNAAPPRGHNWETLFDALEPGTIKAILMEFNRNIKSDPVLSNLAFINQEAVKTIDFRRSLAAAKNTFDKRRYLYEPMEQGEWFYAHLIRDAIRSVAKMDPRLAGLSKTWTDVNADVS